MDFQDRERYRLPHEEPSVQMLNQLNVVEQILHNEYEGGNEARIKQKIEELRDEILGAKRPINPDRSTFQSRQSPVKSHLEDSYYSPRPRVTMVREDFDTLVSKNLQLYDEINYLDYKKRVLQTSRSLTDRYRVVSKFN